MTENHCQVIMEYPELIIGYDFRKAALLIDDLREPQAASMREAFQLAARGELDEAAASLETLAKGENFKASLHAGICHVLRRKPVEASALFERASAIKEDEY